MLIKKLVIPLASLFIGTSVMASDLKVGDKMPDFSKGKAIKELHWYNPDFSKKGKLVQYDLDNDGISDIVVAQRDCEGYKIVFGVYDYGAKKLYLDNKPLDGLIDEIVSEVEGRNVYDDAPNCQRKV